MTGRGRQIATIVTAAAIALGIVAAPVAAHPLGNFTTNTATDLRFDPDGVTVDRILDLAEIPALQAIQRGDLAPGTPTDDAGSTFASATCGELADSIEVTVDGRRVELAAVGDPALSYPPGEAGLDTLRLECRLRGEVALDGTTHDVAVADGAYPDRLGWREITASGDAVRVRGEVPEVSPSERLRAYPEQQLASPIDLRATDLVVQAGGGARTTVPLPAGVPEPVVRGVDRISAAFTDLIAVDRLSVPFALLALLVAIVLGALHAFAPGHGKTVIAAYLIGRQGTPRDAFLLGGTVAVTHTLGVLLLGSVLTVTTTISPESLYPWLGAASGTLFTAIGVLLLRQARRTGGHVHGPGGHVHTPDGRIVAVPLDAPPAQVREVTSPATAATTGHPHDHDHAPRGERIATLDPDDAHHHGGEDHGDEGHGDPGHHHGHDHTAAAPSARRRTPFRGLLLPGLAGGLVPSPSALLVLIGGFTIGRGVFGVGLVVAYGVGMAATLVGAGYLLLRLRGRFDRATQEGTRWPRLLRVARFLPTVTASAIIAGGVIIVIRSLLS